MLLLEAAVRTRLVTVVVAHSARHSARVVVLILVILVTHQVAAILLLRRCGRRKVGTVGQVWLGRHTPGALYIMPAVVVVDLI